jgi:hypothetical protein
LNWFGSRNSRSVVSRRGEMSARTARSIGLRAAHLVGLVGVDGREPFALQENIELTRTSFAPLFISTHCARVAHSSATSRAAVRASRRHTPAAQAAASDRAAAKRQGEDARVVEPGQDRLLDPIERHALTGDAMRVALERAGDSPDAARRAFLRSLRY